MVSLRNIVVVAIMQVGVIVAGVLGAGICYKVWTMSDLALPLAVALLCHSGPAWLLIPLVWGAGTVALQLRSQASDDLKILAFCLGVVILIGLAVFVIYADVTPWFQITWGLGNGGGDDGQ